MLNCKIVNSTHIARNPLIFLLALLSYCFGTHAEETTTYTLPGLEEPAEILVDTWGVPHIYANTHYDAFFVQGFNAARDRLWQIDLWRKRGLGRLSAVLGPGFVEQDKAARLFVYRGDMYREWLAYGSDAKRISESFTQGINAYIDLITIHPDLLPLEFKILGYMPEKWAASDPVRIRSNGLWRNLASEVMRSITVCNHGLKVDAQRKKLQPEWTTKVPEGLDACQVTKEVISLYSLAKAPVDFSLATHFGGLKSASTDLQENGLKSSYKQSLSMLEERDFDAGSNNWVVAPGRTSSGHPVLANDPHRGHAVPSLRYIAHLNAPGLDVIGAGEPALPGISIGHNDQIAFGLTIFSIDQEDLMVYETKKKSPDLYRYGESWAQMTKVTESIAILGAQPLEVELLFTRHGPVIYEDQENRRAFAVQAAWLQPGMAPYFGSVEYMRAKNWRQFEAALNRWGAPSENQVYADRNGNIGYKPAGLMPIRENYDGLLPVPGDGRYEWQGFYDMDKLPVEYNPERGWIATANSMNLPEDYPYKQIKPGFEWTAPWRSRRIEEVLSKQTKHSIADSLELQRDYLSLPARRVLAALNVEDLPSPASHLFRDWDFVLSRKSGATALFEIWFRNHLIPAVMVQVTGIDNIDSLGTLDSLVVVEEFEKLSAEDKIRLAAASLKVAIAEARQIMGDDTKRWNWGSMHKIRLKHPLVNFVDEETQRLLSLPAMSRGGSRDTINNTGYLNGYDVVSGASWRMVIDLADWDTARMTSTPGQSGNADSKHYDNLLENWANDGSLPLLYSRKKIEANLSSRYVLVPGALVPE